LRGTTLEQKLQQARLNVTTARPNDAGILPSGLSAAQAGEIAGQVATALRRANRSAVGLTAGEINFGDGQIELAPGNPPGTTDVEQAAFAGLLYTIATGDKFAGNFKNLPEGLANVLEKGHNGGYNSLSELAGAFGWSLYRLNLPQTAPKRQNYVSKRLQNIAPMVVPPVLRWLLPAGAVLAIAALVIFVAFSAFTTPARETPEAARSVPNAGATATLTTPPAIQTSRANNGAKVIRYNPGTEASPVFTAPGLLRPGEVSSNGQQTTLTASARWSPDGRQINLSLTDGGYETWDLDTQKRISRRELPNADSFLYVSWSPDGANYAALGFDGTLQLGNAAGAKKIVSFINQSSYTWQRNFTWQNFAWASDSTRLLAKGYNNSYRVWSFQPEITELGLDRPRDTAGLARLAVKDVKWSGDGKYIGALSSSPRNFTLFDGYTLEERYTLELNLPEMNENANPTAPVQRSPGNMSFRLSANGDYLALNHYYWTYPTPASVGEQENKIFIIELPKPQTFPPGQDVNLKADKLQRQTIDFPSQSRFVEGDNNVLEWANDNQLLIGLAQYDPKAIARMPTTELYFYAKDPNKPYWQTRRTDSLKLASQPRFFWSENARQLLYNNPYTNELWMFSLPNESTKPPNSTVLKSKAGEVESYWTPSPDSKNVAYVNANERLIVRETATWREILSDNLAQTHYGPGLNNISPISWSQDGQWLALKLREFGQAPNDKIKLWKYTDGKLVEQGTLALPIFGFNTTVWLEKDGKTELGFEIGTGELLAWDLSRPLLSVDEQNKRWDATGIIVRPQNGIGGTTVNGRANYAAFGLPVRVASDISDLVARNGNPFDPFRYWLKDGRLLATTGGNSIIAIIGGSQPLTSSLNSRSIQFEPSPGSVNDYTLSHAVAPDEKSVAFGLPNGLVNIYDLTSGKLLKSFTAHRGIINTIRFSPDSKRLLTASTDKTVKTWDITAERNLHVLQGFRYAFYGAEWLDGQTLVVTGLGGLSVWKLEA
jgi:WD40 repeat protein